MIVWLQQSVTCLQYLFHLGYSQSISCMWIKPIKLWFFDNSYLITFKHYHCIWTIPKMSDQQALDKLAVVLVVLKIILAGESVTFGDSFKTVAIRYHFIQGLEHDANTCDLHYISCHRFLFASMSGPNTIDECTLSASWMLTEDFMTLMNPSSNRINHNRSAKVIKDNKKSRKLVCKVSPTLNFRSIK